MAHFNLIRGIKVSRIASSIVSLPSPADSLKATVDLRVEGAQEVSLIVLTFCSLFVRCLYGPKNSVGLRLYEAFSIKYRL